MMCMIVFIAGASIHACRRSGRHLVAFEKDSAIFDAILAPLCDSLPPAILHSLACEDDDESIQKVPRKSCLSA